MAPGQPHCHDQTGKRNEHDRGRHRCPETAPDGRERTATSGERRAAVITGTGVQPRRTEFFLPQCGRTLDSAPADRRRPDAVADGGHASGPSSVGPTPAAKGACATRAGQTVGRQQDCRARDGGKPGGEAEKPRSQPVWTSLMATQPPSTAPAAPVTPMMIRPGGPPRQAACLRSCLKPGREDPRHDAHDRLLNLYKVASGGAGHSGHKSRRETPKKLRACAAPLKFGCSCRSGERPHVTLRRHRRLRAKSSQQLAPGGQCRANDFAQAVTGVRQLSV